MPIYEYNLIRRYVRASDLIAMSGLGEPSTDEGRTSWAMTSVVFANGQAQVASAPIVNTQPIGGHAVYVQRFAGADAEFGETTPAGTSPDAVRVKPQRLA